MKIFILFSLLTLTTLTSCVKTTKCDCPSGTSLSVNGNDDEEIRANCEAKSNGLCTH